MRFWLVWILGMSGDPGSFLAQTTVLASRHPRYPIPNRTLGGGDLLGESTQFAAGWRPPTLGLYFRCLDPTCLMLGVLAARAVYQEFLYIGGLLLIIIEFNTINFPRTEFNRKLFPTT